MFLAHEPAAIRFGRRGVRAAREYGAAAARWLRACVTCALGAGIGAALIIEPSLRWSLAVPALPTLVLAAAMVRGQEKSWYGEIAAALAFAGAAVPVALAAGAPPDAAWHHVAIPFALLFATTTLAVRVVILRVRGGGNPQATAATRGAVMTVSLSALLVIAGLAAGRVVPLSMLIAAAPGLATAIVVAARPPSATRLRPLGWSLVTVSTLTATIVLLTA